MQTVQLINGIDRSRIKPFLVYFEQQQDILDKLDESNLTVTRIPRRRKFDPKMISALADYIDEHEIDVVHATLLIGSFFAQRAVQASRTRCPFVAAMHSTASRSLKEELIMRLIYNRSLQKAKRLIFVSDVQRDYWLSRYRWMKDRSVTIHNGIAPEDFVRDDHFARGQALLEKHQIDAGRNIVSCIAAFREEKNHELLIDAVALTQSDFCLCLAGSGPRLPAIEDKVARLGLSDRVVFLGRLSDVRPLLAVSTMSIMSSNSEAFSMAMLESLAMQVPMLSTDVGGMSEAIIPGKTGLLVKPRDAGELARGIDTLLSDPAGLIEMGKLAEQWVKQRFTRTQMLAHTEDLLVEAARA